MSESVPSITPEALLAESGFVRGLARSLLRDEAQPDEGASRGELLGLTLAPDLAACQLLAAPDHVKGPFSFVVRSPNAGVAILLDGEFAKKVLQRNLGKFPAASDFSSLCDHIMSHPDFSGRCLHRVYYYTADPLTGKSRHPLTRSETDFGSSAAFSRNTQLIDRLENQPDVAVRRGALAHQGWQIGRVAARELARGNKNQIDAHRGQFPSGDLSH